MSIIKGNTSVFDLAFDAIQNKDGTRFAYLFNLCVRANTNNYVFAYYLWQKCHYKKNDADIFDTRTLKLFRNSLAKFIKQHKAKHKN